PRDEDPGFTIRTAMVTTVFPGASPERVEKLVTDKLEEEIREMPEIDFIASQSKPGISIIFVNIKESYKAMRPIWDNLRRKVQAAQQALPDNIQGPFVNDEFGDVFGTMIALTGEGYTYRELKEIADDCRNDLLLIEEIAKIDIAGDQEERIFVEFNGATLAQQGISPGQLRQILASRNIIFPGGEIFTRDEQILLEPSGNFESVEELAQSIIKLPGREELIRLSDIARVYRGYADPPGMTITHKQQPALVLAISLREGGNIINLGEAVRARLQRFREVYPIGVDFNVIYFQPDFVQKKIDDFVSSLMQSVGIVLLVMLLFLGVRSGLVIASLIPASIIMALMVMGFLDIGLDQMSLAALIIALGMLVDNAIVMSESIMVQVGEGKDLKQASIDAAKELRVPLLTSSLTTAAAFLPIYLAESTTGEYTASIFEVVSISLLCSWMLALTMIPLLCVTFLKIKPQQGETYNTRFYRSYRGLLSSSLRHPVLFVVGIVVLFYASTFLLPFIPAIFFPPNDKPVMYAEFQYPVGTPLEKTRRMAEKVEAFIQDSLIALYGEDRAVLQEGVIDWTSFVGEGPPRFYLSLNAQPPAPEYAYFLINVTDRWAMDTNFIPRLEAFAFQNFPDISTTIAPLLLGPPVVAPIQVRISGKTTEAVFQLVDRVKGHLQSIDGLTNIRDDWGPRIKKLFVRINQPRAQRVGLTSQDIAISLQSILTGIEISDYRENEDVIPIVLRSVAADRRDIGKLESHNIFVQATGRSVPLKQVADVEVAFQTSKILRRDGLQTVTINANLLPGYNAISLANALQSWLETDQQEWPVGYLFEQGGELESAGEANASIGAKMPIGLLVIILLLVFQFDSLRRPLIILLTIPLGLIGVFIGMLITQQPLGFMAFLGVISLSGIVINNAIVLIDRIKLEIEENGLEPAQAIIEASQRRLRPILLTTATTVGGLLPLYFGGGAMFAAMAAAILSGLIFATLLTLGFVPVLYSLFFRVSFKDYRGQ
ncbi:MAG TPA: efflux RND transporter permease subunit, partial [Calditrichia bacterium]|nr:efflux RND transporter permease subunit [Calditrichia bacterium]